MTATASASLPKANLGAALPPPSTPALTYPLEVPLHHPSPPNYSLSGPEQHRISPLVPHHYPLPR